MLVSEPSSLTRIEEAAKEVDDGPVLKFSGRDVSIEVFVVNYK
jgi:hypothetical protein